MNRSLLIGGMLMLMLTAGTAWAFDPPRIIGEFYAPDPQAWGRSWGRGHYCLGDVNFDGKDDLFIQESIGPEQFPCNVRLHFGRERMSNEPDLVFSAGPDYRDRFSTYGSFPGYLGRLLPNYGSLFAITGYHADRAFDPTQVSIFVFEASAELDTLPESIWSWYGAQGPFLTGASPIYPDLRPSDFNGDGTPDLMYCIGNIEWNELRICYGGENFDSIPDWQYRMPYGGRLTFSIGRDINDDGCDDVLLMSISPRGDITPEYWIFLGGTPMDTIPLFRFKETDFEGPLGDLEMRAGFNLLSDVNNDGYDDWGIYWYDQPGMRLIDGFYIFFGSAEPDLEPDLTLEGRRQLDSHYGYLSGGDFNDDGVGDIVTGLFIEQSNTSETMIHFGQRWLDSRADIFLYSEREYGGRYSEMSEVGAVGDYNDDGCDDFCARGTTGRDSTVLLVFAGSRRWRVDVNESDQPIRHNLTLTATPNPFNGAITLEYSHPVTGGIDLTVFNIMGQSQFELKRGQSEAGAHSAKWESSSAGIYFVRLNANGNSIVTKILCLP